MHTDTEVRRHTKRRGWWVVCMLLSCGLAAVGCSQGYVPEAGADADAAGVDADPTEDADGDPPNFDDTDGATPRFDAGDGNGGGDDAGGSNTCTVEGDGIISRDEVPLEAGLKAIFRVAHDASVDTRGETSSGGERTWDLTENYSGDHAEAIELQSMDGKWFKPDFPDGDYAMKLAGDAEELGVFQITSDALLMLGVVSPTDGSTTTNIEYDPPVKVLDFPLEKGKSWKTETEASGTHATWSPWTPITYNETYTSQVDATGVAKTPHSDLDVLRVRTKLERSAAISGVPLGTIRTFAFVAECFGTVATIRSKQGESQTEFDEAAEVRRLSK